MSIKNEIIKTIKEKSETKQSIYDYTFSAFQLLKEELQLFTESINKGLKDSDTRNHLKYTNKGDFEAELKVAGDLLIFNMHTNIFELQNSRNIWQTTYAQNQLQNQYCGVINIYNFLSDSFKYNRLDDVGYLIARIFIKEDNTFFVEENYQLGFVQNHLQKAEVSSSNWQTMIESIVKFALEFELFVPYYTAVQEISVAQMLDRINTSKSKTGKRLGFKFYSEDNKTM